MPQERFDLRMVYELVALSCHVQRSTGLNMVSSILPSEFDFKVVSILGFMDKGYVISRDVGPI